MSTPDVLTSVQRCSKNNEVIARHQYVCDGALTNSVYLTERITKDSFDTNKELRARDTKDSHFKTLTQDNPTLEVSNSLLEILTPVVNTHVHSGMQLRRILHVTKKKKKIDRFSPSLRYCLTCQSRPLSLIPS